jgi:hypothetical protein
MPGKSLVRVAGKRATISFEAGSIESTKPVSDATGIESECGVTAMNFAIVPDLGEFATWRTDEEVKRAGETPALRTATAKPR